MKKSISKILAWEIPLPESCMLAIAVVVVFLIYLALGIWMDYRPIDVFYMFCDIFYRLLISVPVFVISFCMTGLLTYISLRINKKLDNKFLFRVLLISIPLLFIIALPFTPFYTHSVVFIYKTTYKITLQRTAPGLSQFELLIIAWFLGLPLGTLYGFNKGDSGKESNSQTTSHNMKRQTADTE